MNYFRPRLSLLWMAIAGVLLVVTCAETIRGQNSNVPGVAAPKTPPVLGTIKSIAGNLITLAPDNGAEIKVSVPTDAKLLSVPPGSNDLKEATRIQFADLQPGDRVLVRAKVGDDPSSMIAASVIAMKKSDISEKQAHEREDWQRRGIGGLVKNADPGTNTITIGTMTATGSKDVAIHAGPATVIRRYAPGSVKFDDAKRSSIGEIHVGDQLRARGTKSPDGLDFAADEIVSGAFRNLSGTITGIDANAGTMTVSDLTTKKSVEVKITSDSQLRKIPAPIVQRIAMRLKGIPAGAGGPANVPSTAAGAGQGAAAGGQTTPGSGGAGMAGGPANRAGGGDMQQILSRLPASTMNDFQKGDAVMIVATGDAKDAQVTAITLLGGVEPIFQGSNDSQATSILSPWSLSSGGGDAGTP